MIYFAELARPMLPMQGAVHDVSHGITEQSGHVQVGISCWLMHICFPNFELIFLSNGAFDFDSV